MVAPAVLIFAAVNEEGEAFFAFTKSAKSLYQFGHTMKKKKVE
jgi:hypothetical protein